MAKRKQVPQKQYDLYLEMLEGFASEYGVEFTQFTSMHLRMEGMTTTMDCWPTTGRYWVKQSGLGEGGRMGEKGFLPGAYLELHTFLSELFKRDVENVQT
jgi:hypothetical protein